MSTDSNENVASILRGAARDAGAATGALPSVDAAGLVTAAGRRTIRSRWRAAALAAATVVVATAGGVLAWRVARLPTPADLAGPVPEHIIALVDSLYSTPDYVNEAFAGLAREGATGAGSYLDDVWDSVVNDITDG